jgi:hypothetical protein
MEILITESQYIKIFEQQKKVVQTVAPKNATYVTQNDWTLTSDSTFGGDLKIPKGTKFTAHQIGDPKVADDGGEKYWVSVDRMVDVGKFDPYAKEPQKQKLTYSTIFWCSGKNAGKFWNVPSKSWYVDEKKILSNQLSKNLCYKAYGDQYNIKNADKWSEQAALKKEKASLEGYKTTSLYKDANGVGVPYVKSVDYSRNVKYLSGLGLITNNLPTTPVNQSHHFNLSALLSIKTINDKFINSVGAGTSSCLNIGIFATMPHKKFANYGYNTAIKLSSDPGSLLEGIIKAKDKELYANFILTDFIFNYPKLINDVNAGAKNKMSANGGLSSEYFPDGVMRFMEGWYKSYNVSAISKYMNSSPQPRCKGGGWLTPERTHMILDGLQIASMFVPVVGPFLAAGIGTVNSAVYFTEGKNTEAAITLGLSLLPMVSKIPGVKAIATTTLESIAVKVASKAPTFTALEESALKTLWDNSKALKTEIKAYINQISENPNVQSWIKTGVGEGEKKVEEKIRDNIQSNTGIYTSVKQISKSGIKNVG